MCENVYAPLAFMLHTAQKTVCRGHWEWGLGKLLFLQSFSKCVPRVWSVLGSVPSSGESSEWLLNSPLCQFASVVHPGLSPAPFCALEADTAKSIPRLLCHLSSGCVWPRRALAGDQRAETERGLHHGWQLHFSAALVVPITPFRGQVTL